MEVTLTPHRNILTLTLSSEHVRENLFPVNAHASKMFGKRGMSIKETISFFKFKLVLCRPFSPRVFTAPNNKVSHFYALVIDLSSTHAMTEKFPVDYFLSLISISGT